MADGRNKRKCFDRHRLTHCGDQPKTTSWLEFKSSRQDLTRMLHGKGKSHRAITAARFYGYETLYAQYERGFVSDQYWNNRIVPAVGDWAPVWAKLFATDELSSRRNFMDEIERITAGQD